MGTIEFVRKLYNGKNCYSDHMSDEELELLHIPSSVEEIISQKLSDGKIIFLTGNPGDGKTFIIKSIKDKIPSETYIETDLNTISDYSEIAQKIIDCVRNSKPAIIAVNEYPFFLLQKAIREMDHQISSRISLAQRSSIIYGFPSEEQEKQILVIDLNDRNLLESNGQPTNKSSEIIDKICSLLKKEQHHNTTLTANLRALSDDNVKGRLLELIEYAIISTEHFAVRDILGAFAYILTDCLNDEEDELSYFDAIFNGVNPLLRSIQQFDPIYLTSPDLDEDLWNGEQSVKTGWMFGAPTKWPNDESFDEDPNGAMDLFKSIKRKYYFENTSSNSLVQLQRINLDNGRQSLKNFELRKKDLKQSIVRGLNRLFFPSSKDGRYLQIWTTHRYDLSNEISTAVSTKNMDANQLELVCPCPTDWLQGMEYTPNHLLLRPKRSSTPSLYLDVDFLRILGMVDKGYPTALLPSHFEQTAATFLQKLDERGLTEENYEGEILIANRRTGFQMKVTIENDKYNFE